MIRTAKYLSRVVFEYLLMAAGMLAAALAFYAFTTPASEYEYAGGVATGITLTAGLMFPILLELSFVPAYVPLFLSMSATRRDVFAGLQVAKAQLVLGLGALTVLAQIAVQVLFGTEPIFMGSRLVGLCAAMFISGAVGELGGMAVLRFGRKGVVVFSLLLGVGAGSLGIVMGMLELAGKLDGTVDLLLNFFLNNEALIAAALGSYLVTAALGWLICRRFAVK